MAALVLPTRLNRVRDEGNVGDFALNRGDTFDILQQAYRFGDDVGIGRRAVKGHLPVGDFDVNRNGPTPPQLDSLARLSAYLKLRLNLNDNRIRLHSQVGQTVCPGRYFPEADFRRLTRKYVREYAPTR